MSSSFSSLSSSDEELISLLLLDTSSTETWSSTSKRSSSDTLSKSNSSTHLKPNRIVYHRNWSLERRKSKKHQNTLLFVLFAFSLQSEFRKSGVCSNIISSNLIHSIQIGSGRIAKMLHILFSLLLCLQSVRMFRVSWLSSRFCVGIIWKVMYITLKKEN